mmetsp:Transcript_27770/g.50627  ORF Transcript_27770/g.50627 Transcript_27770/m.50627 type:complete len:217 (-) Transcript_27770:377-1027(-)
MTLWSFPCLKYILRILTLNEAVFPFPTLLANTMGVLCNRLSTPPNVTAPAVLPEMLAMGCFTKHKLNCALCITCAVLICPQKLCALRSSPMTPLANCFSKYPLTAVWHPNVNAKLNSGACIGLSSSTMGSIAGISAPPSMGRSCAPPAYATSDASYAVQPLAPVESDPLLPNLCSIAHKPFVSHFPKTHPSSSALLTGQCVGLNPFESCSLKGESV